MTSVIPITLVGENLGKRQWYLNSLVNEAVKQNEDFGSIENILEQSPLDRLFKIDIASKIRNVNYIIKNLKDDDVLYVSRALKAKWLIEHEEIINPQYLEDNLYPEMIMTAVSKMKNWVYINLADTKRCEDFYQYYKGICLKAAMKFLMNCSKDFIANEFTSVVHKINPAMFKVLCEKCPQVAKIFFDLLSIDKQLKCQYLDRQKEYFASLKYCLKTDADFVLDIYEKYFNKDLFKGFSPPATKYIMDKYKIRFLQKPELYAAYLLHLPTLAQSLNSEECKKLVLKLARAKYLSRVDWFSYKTVEPFIKRLKPEERAEFKKRVFVIKDIGEEIEDWPYQTPASPESDQPDYKTIFDDRQYEPSLYGSTVLKKRRIRKKKGDYGEIMQIESANVKTLLDKLFDEYRFVSFGRTLFELRKRIPTESSPQNREFVMLVLVSKTGGRPDAIASLLQLLAQHSNETPNVRAAIIRSLVKRAQVWKLPTESWNQLLEFGHGLGLDGKPPVADCIEGLHAVVIRSLLLYGKCEPEIQKAFLSKFSNFIEYGLSETEKKSISELLPKMLLSIVKEKEDMRSAVHWIEKVFETLNAYKVNLETFPGLIDTICKLAENDDAHIDYLLITLFESRIARKKLFRWTFNLIRTDASYVNALRHDPTVLNVKTFIELYDGMFMKIPEQFLKKLSLYFNEENGLASKYLFEFIAKANDKKYGRLIAILLGNKLESYLRELDATENKEQRSFAASIRANAHTTRPQIDIENLGWKKAGVKMIANKVLICRAIEIDKNIEKLLQWKRTIRVALALSKRTDYETDIFLKIAKIKPKTAIKTGIKLIKSRSEKVDIRIWETIKPMMQTMDITSDKMEYLVRYIAGIIKFMPLKIRPDYSVVIYLLLINNSMPKAMPPLCHVEKLLPDINDKYIEEILEKFLTEYFTISNLSDNQKSILYTCLYIRILVKFLFLCKDEDTQKKRWDKIGMAFLARMEEIFKLKQHKELFSKYLDETLLTLKYSQVFLDPQYVSPQLIMENTLFWIRGLFPLEKHFEMYTKIHLLMLHLKAVRQGVRQFPEIFSDERKTRKEGVEIVGRILGKYIVREVKTLREQYFDTITELYAKGLAKFMEDYNNYDISSEFLSSVLKGILEDSNDRENLVSIQLLAQKSGSLKHEHHIELIRIVKGMTDPVLQTVVFANLFT